MAASAFTLESPERIAANAAGRITPEQRRALGRDLYATRWKTPVASLGWIAISLVMLRILLPVAGTLLPVLLTDNDRGRAPLRFANGVILTLPLWAMLKWGLVLLALAYVATCVVQVARFVAFLRVRQQLLYGPVASVVGEVRHRDGQPLAIFADRQVRPWHPAVMAGVTPGRYRFFLLPRHDWLLSAQRLRDGERPTADEDALAARYSLRVIAGCDPDALPENRAGRLTAAQVRWLRASAPDIGWRTIVLFGFAIAVGAVGAAVYGRAAMRGGFTRDRLEGIVAGLAWAAIWVAILVKQCVDHANQRRDASDGTVRVYEGIVTKWEGWEQYTEGSRVWIRRYECAEGRFPVSQAAFRALADGLVHRVYFTPRRTQLVNIELLPAPAPAPEETDAFFSERGYRWS